MSEDQKTQLDENAVCDNCGRSGAFVFGDHHLCIDCYQGRCSCCPEFGADDLWEPEPKESERSESRGG